MLRIAVLVSGGGTNLQALIDSREKEGLGGGERAGGVASRKDAYALKRAEAAGIKGYVLSGKGLTTDEYGSRLCELLENEVKPELVVLAGFLKVLSTGFCKKYENRIINIHPSLIPSFCGDGMYGLKVHEAALAKGVRVSGATVHFVDAVTDGGPIILQKAVEVHEGDTPEVLQKRIMDEAEHILLPRAVRLFCKGALSVKDGRVFIDENKAEE